MKKNLSLFLFACAVMVSIQPYAADFSTRPEHPRPDFRRDAWINLNGQWQFAFDPQSVGDSQGWYKDSWKQWPQTIRVPFPWESGLSGIEKTGYKGTAWYRRTFTVPPAWKDRHLYLVFGAVDWYAKVWVDGEEVGEHEGGYTPFSLRVDPFLNRNEIHTLTVKVIDNTSPEQLVGKQINWYTTTSGIWQTVYLEARSDPFIQDIHIQSPRKTPVSIQVDVAGKLPSDVRVEMAPDLPPDPYGLSHTIDPSWVEGDALQKKISIPNPRYWSVDSPHLYFVKLNLYAGGKLVDTVHTYFGIRDVSISRYKNQPYQSIHLNGKPFYLLSALDQSFHPAGIHTFPSDNVIKQDILDAKEFGFNNLRIHIKIDEPRLYYWADRLGMTILYDIPCFRKVTEKSKQAFEYTLRQAIQRDKNHPSIIAWILFNETWGLQLKRAEHVDFVKEMYQLAKQLDTSRLVEDNSANKRDHIVTDINSWHFYRYDYPVARDLIKNVVEQTFPGSPFNFLDGYQQGNQPMINSEYGGVSAGMGDRDISWCFHYLTQELRKYPKIGGYVYTELQDIEWEHNGFMNYDRSRKDFGYEEFVPVPSGHPPFTYRDLNTLDFLILDAFPGEKISLSEEHSSRQPISLKWKKEIPVALSLYSKSKEVTCKVNWQLYGMDIYSQKWSPLKKGSLKIHAQPYTVTQGEAIRLSIKNDPGRLYLLYGWAEDRNGAILARNFWTCTTLPETFLHEERYDHKYYRWSPTGFDSVTGTIDEFPEGERDSVAIPGEASISYTLRNGNNEILRSLPADKANLLLELAACAGNARVDWPQRIRRKSTPQTDRDKKCPSVIEVWVKGERIATLLLPDDPADYRGILSNIYELAPPSSYGYLQKISIPTHLLRKEQPFTVELKTAEGTSGGIRVFGSRSGRYILPPTLQIIP